MVKFFIFAVRAIVSVRGRIERVDFARLSRFIFKVVGTRRTELQRFDASVYTLYGRARAREFAGACEEMLYR